MLKQVDSGTTAPPIGASGWLVFGGTSVSSPTVAGVYALAGNSATLGATYAYICNAGPGYDGPTGWGTPNGASTAAF